MQKPTEAISENNKENEEEDGTHDENNFGVKNLFLMSLVPLRLLGNPNSKEEIVLWDNPRPSSTQWCRPLRMLYKKETSTFTIQQVNNVREEIENLQPFVKGTLICKYQMCLTMLDGKAISALTEVAAQNCHICQAKPSQMNNLNRAEHRDPDNLSYGLTTMHAWIKCMQCILNISYYLKLKQPTIRNADALQREEIKTRKSIIKENLRKHLGIYVDRVIQGRGTSNTGNVGRTFLRNYRTVSEITEIDENLIRRFYLIMIALSSGQKINYENFKKFTTETAELYISKYNWYRMPVSIHKLLIHGAETARSLILPIGMMSEEAQESCNKLYRRVRERHSRKDRMIHTTQDVLNNMILLSDPVITNIRSANCKKGRQELPTEVLNLIIRTREVDEEDEDFP